MTRTYVQTYVRTVGWFGPTKEQKKAKAEFEKWQKKFNERSPTGMRKISQLLLKKSVL